MEGTIESKAADGYEPSSPIAEGVITGNRGAVARLLSRGYSANKPIRLPDGTLVPLIVLAAEQGHRDVVALLLDREALVNAALSGNTALHTACYFAHEGVVRLLLAAGASATLENNQGLSAIDYATAPRHAAVRQILQEHTDAGAPCTQLVAVASSGSAGASSKQVQVSASGPAAQAEGRPATGMGRAFRFHCHAPGCPHSEESLQRRLAKCGRCRAIRYCSQECVNADWKAHKPQCHAPSLEGDVGPSHGAGAGAGASSRGVKKRVKPRPPASEGAGAEVSAGPSPAAEGRVARVCGWPGCSEPAKQKCARCERVRYCSREHQKAHWAEHKPVCQAVSSEGGVDG